MTYSTRAIPFQLKNVAFNFPRLAKAHSPRFENNIDGPQFSVQVLFNDECAEDMEAYQTLKDIGVSMTEFEGIKALNLKAYVTNARGEPNDFKVYDSELNELSIEERETIGRGSEGHIVGYMYKNAHGSVSVRMTDLVVTFLNERTEMSRVERIRAQLEL